MKALLKKVYALVPFKREFYRVLRVFWKPKHTIYKHLHFVGVFAVPVASGKKFKIKHYGFQLENELFWKGIQHGWEKESINLWIKLCEQSEVILDIGANTGVFALLAKTIHPQATVLAFEPVERVYNKLAENIQLNNFDILAVKAAVSNTDGTAFIYDTGGEHVYSVTVNKNLSMPDTQVEKTTIDTLTLNTFIKKNKLKKIDLVKIDVETHEPEVLEGFSEFISEFKPTLLIEILNDEVGAKVEAFIKHLDYEYYSINEKKGIRKVDCIKKSDDFNYLLCTREVRQKIGLVL